MMCGVLAVMFEHYSEAQTFLERATSLDTLSVVAWTLLGEMRICFASCCYCISEQQNDTTKLHLSAAITVCCLPPV